jgi:hypothetical protein
MPLELSLHKHKHHVCVPDILQFRIKKMLNFSKPACQKKKKKKMGFVSFRKWACAYGRKKSKLQINKKD